MKVAKDAIAIKIVCPRLILSITPTKASSASSIGRKTSAVPTPIAKTMADRFSSGSFVFSQESILRLPQL